MICKLAAPRGSLFEPEERLLSSDPDEQGGNQSTIGDVKISGWLKPPAIRAVCRESRRVSDDIGGFKFGIFGNSRQGCWINYQADAIFIHTDMLDLLPQMDLGRVRILVFPKVLFKTEAACMRILDSIQRGAPQCQKVFCCFCAEISLERKPLWPVSTARFNRLLPEDRVGESSFSPNRGLTADQTTWITVRRVIDEIWREAFERSDVTMTPPSLHGVDLLF